MDNTLWIIDIDGTIVNVHKNQVPAWNKALMETYGFTPDEKTLFIMAEKYLLRIKLR